MKPTRVSLLLAGAIWGAAAATAQIADSPDGTVAGIPVNYTEAKVGSFELPDPLVTVAGRKVGDAEAWHQRRRPELLRLLEENQFGRVPGRPADQAFDLFDRGTPAFEGRARRKQVTIYFTASRSEHYVDVLYYLPVGASGPVPLLLQFGWAANNLAVATADPGVKVGRRWDASQQRRVPAVPGGGPGRGPGRNLNVMPVLERGYGLAVFNYTDIEPDAPGAAAQGVRGAIRFPGHDAPTADAWGAIAAWGWGASRIIDFLETDPEVDARRIAITGASRLGKTVLWMAARDERVAGVIASVSGEGGAALSRRDYGETVAHLVAPSRYPYQFAANYARWAGRMHEAPFDAHCLIALIAPRPVLLQTGSTDKWSDPYGEFLAAKAATPVYALLGQSGIPAGATLEVGQARLSRLGYFMHDGPHGVLPTDWPVFLDFLDAQVKSGR